MKQFKAVVITIAAILGVFFAACGSDSGMDSSARDSFAHVETIYDLGECEESNEGDVKRVESEGRFYTCREETWIPEFKKESKENDGWNSSDKDDKYSSSSYEDDKIALSFSQDSTPSAIGAGSEYDVIHNTLKDLRDGKIYRTMFFGGDSPQIWMAENLDYIDTAGTSSLQKRSWCYKNNESQCSNYGRFYIWESAMGACPSGWHLPSKNEWETLVKKMRGDSIAGKYLSTFGFVDKFVGFMTDADSEFKGSNSAQFWSATPGGNPKNESYRVIMNDKQVHIITVSSNEKENKFYTEESRYYVQKFEGLSVRCIKDTVFENEINPPAEYNASDNAMRDMRDGKVYRTVKIGDYIWMAQNLSYSDSIRTPMLWGETGCYKDKLDSCAKYGRFYNQDVSDIVCPVGWHLPYAMEVENLIISVGGKEAAVNSLRSTSGWIEDYPSLFHKYVYGIGEWPDEYNGTDVFGFSALPSYCSFTDLGSECEVVFLIANGGAFKIDQKIDYEGNAGYSYYGNVNVYEAERLINLLYLKPIRCVKDYAYEY